MMIKKNCKTQSILFFSILILWGILIAHFCFICPMYPDEMVNSFVIEGNYNLIYTSSRMVTNIGDVWTNFIKIYQLWTGRYTSSFVVYLFRILPHWVYCLINSIASVLYAYLTIKISKTSSKSSSSEVSIIDVSLVFLICSFIISSSFFDQVFVWETGSIVYSHMFVLAMLFIMLYLPVSMPQEDKSHNSLLHCVLYISIGLLVGGTLEHLAPSIFAISFILVITKLTIYKKSVKKLLPHLLGIISLFIGTCILILSPGNSARNSNASVSNLFDKIRIPDIVNFLITTINSNLSTKPQIKFFFIAWIVLFIYCIIKKRVVSIFMSLLMILGAFLSTLLLYFSPYLDNRIWSVSFMFLTLSFFILLNESLILILSISKNILYVLCFIIIVFAGFIIGKNTIIYHNEYSSLLADKNAQIEFIEKSIADGNNILSIKSVNDIRPQKLFIIDVQSDSEIWVNRLFARWYGADVVMPGENAAYNFEQLDTSSLLDSPVLFDDKIALNQIYLANLENGTAILKFKFNKDLDVERLYSYEKKWNFIALTCKYLNDGEATEAYRPFSPIYKLDEEGNYTTYTTIPIPENIEKLDLDIQIYNPDKGETFSTAILIEDILNR